LAREGLSGDHLLYTELDQKVKVEISDGFEERKQASYMPIVIRKGSESCIVSPIGFSKESELEHILADFPDLLLEDPEIEDLDSKKAPAIKFVDRQVTLPEAGILDLLFVDSEGVPIAVEAKLARNAEARREVVAQVIDYLSSLTSLTVDELDQRVNGKLDLALHALTAGGSETDFDSHWQLVGANLRDGRARLVVVLDEAPADLQRIFRFLARKSDLDVLLLSVQRYSSLTAGEILVPQLLVSAESADRPRRTGSSKEPYPELVAVFDAYNASAPQDLRAVGEANNYRMIRPADWPSRIYAGYSFQRRRGQIDVQLGISGRINPAAAQGLAAMLTSFAGKKVANDQVALAWDQDYRGGGGRLFVGFPLTAPAETIAQGMRDLLFITRTKVGEMVKALAGQKPAGVA
jgi:hypothetical protein